MSRLWFCLFVFGSSRNRIFSFFFPPLTASRNHTDGNGIFFFFFFFFFLPRPHRGHQVSVLFSLCRCCFYFFLLLGRVESQCVMALPARALLTSHLNDALDKFAVNATSFTWAATATDGASALLTAAGNAKVAVDALFREKCVEFDGFRASLTGAAPGTNATGGWLIAAAVMNLALPNVMYNQSMIWDRIPNADGHAPLASMYLNEEGRFVLQVRTDTTATDTVLPGLGTSPVANLNEWHVVMIHRSIRNESVDLWVNGSQFVSVAVPRTASIRLQPVLIGKHSQHDVLSWKGRLLERFVFGDELSVVELAGVSDYLSRRWKCGGVSSTATRTSTATSVSTASGSSATRTPAGTATAVSTTAASTVFLGTSNVRTSSSTTGTSASTTIAAAASETTATVAAVEPGIIGAIAAAVLAILLLAVLVFLLKHRRRRVEQPTATPSDNRNYGLLPFQPPNYARTADEFRVADSPHYAEISDATLQESNVLRTAAVPVTVAGTLQQ